MSFQTFKRVLFIYNSVSESLLENFHINAYEGKGRAYGFTFKGHVLFSDGIKGKCKS